jgi:hypothetical protein
MAMGAHRLSGSQQQLIRPAHTHAGGQQENSHTSRSRMPITPRRTLRFRPGGMYA